MDRTSGRVAEFFQHWQKHTMEIMPLSMYVGHSCPTRSRSGDVHSTWADISTLRQQAVDLIATRRVSSELAIGRLRQINGLKTQGIIITRRVSEEFSQTRRQTQKLDPSLTQRVEKSQTRNFETGKRGIVLEKGSRFYPSLTFRVPQAR